MKRRDYLPGAAEADYVASTAPAPHPVLCDIEVAAARNRVPILDRESARVLATLAVGRCRILEIGTAFGYSTLWMALAQPHRGTIVTIDPDRSRTARARAWWREAGIEDERIHVVERPALDALADEDEWAVQGPFDLAFLDAVKTEYVDYFEAIMPRLATGAMLVADNVLWGGRTARHATAAEPDADDESTKRLHAFNERLLGDPHFSATILPVGDGLLVAALRA